LGSVLSEAVPHGHWKTTTLVAGLRMSGIIAPLVLDGPMTGKAFRAYVEQCLAPALGPGDVVVQGNLAAHKAKGVEDAVTAVGAHLLYLPPYSPDLNPIEMVFAKLKALLRKAAPRTRHQLWAKVGELLPALAPAECANYLRHCGYGAT
jgi:transposase